MLRILSIIVTLFFFVKSSTSQNDSINQNRLKTLIIAESAIYSGTMIGLSQLWYKDVSKSSFHFFNDNYDWFQMDKIGHATTTYYVGKAGYHALKWSGVNEKKAVWYGGTLGLLLETSVEVLDGFSSEWGFSSGDMIANVSGSALFIAQQLKWKEQRVLLKYSFCKSDYAHLRPNLLGYNLSEQLLKDYNGQTYWLSANINSFFPNLNTPKWLNVALGYSVDGLVGGTDNYFEQNNVIYDYSFIERKRQFYLSLDVDLTRIKTKSKFVNSVFGTFGFLKVPFPAIEFNQGDKTQFKGFYF